MSGTKKPMNSTQNHIDILSVGECLKLNLAIPEYQRPYKWSIQSIDDMLWDISNSIQQSQAFAEYKYRIGTIILHRTGDVLHVSDADFEKLLGHPLPKGKTKIDRNLTLGELNHARSPLGWLVWLVLTILLDVSYKRGKPDLNILFQYNMPLRALAKMTNGAISMGMVDGIVMELQGFWIIGLVRVIYEALKNVVLNAQMEKRLRGA